MAIALMPAVAGAQNSGADRENLKKLGCIFHGFVSWNLCMENVLEGILFDKWLLLNIED